MNYTKGKWYVENKTVIYAFNPTVPVFIADCGQIHGNAEANAHLIAVAPEMYEALKELLRDYSTNPLDDAFYESCLKARQALAKAEGG